MIYIGIDVSSKSFVIHAIDGRKRVVFKGEIFPERRSLLKLLKDLGNEPKYVVFEAGNQMKSIGHAVHIRRSHEHRNIQKELAFDIQNLENSWLACNGKRLFYVTSGISIFQAGR